MPTGRTEAFSDGVLAVAITLLIFNLQAPHVGNGDLAAALLREWPAYASYVVSFMTIGIIWVNHHSVFQAVARVDRPLQFINLMLLMWVCIIPFPTQVLSLYVDKPQSPQARVAALVYSGVLLMMGFSFLLIWIYGFFHPHLFGEHVDRRWLRARLPRVGGGTLLYGFGLVGAFFDARITLLICGLLAIFYMFDVVSPQKRFASEHQLVAAGERNDGRDP